MLTYTSFLHIDAQWSLNGITTGSGKSVVISLTAHYLASRPEITKVVVLTPNPLLQKQMMNKFFSSKHPLAVK